MTYFILRVDFKLLSVLSLKLNISTTTLIVIVGVDSVS